ncbi:DUF2017 domain-containing protein [soil metagenome]
MRAFENSDGGFSAEFEPAEATMLITLAGQITELVEARNAHDGDPAILRLLPDAYPDDAEKSAEFRRFTVDDLASRKVANAREMAEALVSATEATRPTRVHIDEQAAQAWIRSLTDIRLTIASRLGIERDGDEPTDDPDLLNLYDWLGFVQGSLIDVLDD